MPKDQESKDDGRTIIDFVDILFALVVGQVLEVLPRWNAMAADERSHLAFVFVLTLGSWVGYHSSENRESGEVSFDLWSPIRRIALAKLAIDVALVITYWLAAQNLQPGSAAPSVRGSLATAAVTSVLYVLWDLCSFFDPRRLERGSEGSWRAYFSWRRGCSYGFLATIAITIAVVGITGPRTDWAFAATNIVLTALAVGYRVAKEIRNGRTASGSESTVAG
jgi:hypothetical protein